MRLSDVNHNNITVKGEGGEASPQQQLVVITNDEDEENEEGKTTTPDNEEQPVVMKKTACGDYQNLGLDTNGQAYRNVTIIMTWT